MTPADTFAYTCLDAVTAEAALGEWEQAARMRGLLPNGSAEITRTPDGSGLFRVSGAVRTVATVPVLADLDNWFTYHPPAGPADVEAYQKIREAGKAFALTLAEHVPPSRELSHAFTLARDAVMWANAGRACNQADPAPAATSTRQCLSTKTVPAEPGIQVRRYMCTRPEGHTRLTDPASARHRDVEAGPDWADEDSDKRRGICTTCGHPTQPHNMRHPITTGLTGLGKDVTP